MIRPLIRKKTLTKNFERILVPYNGTSGSNKAFRKAVSLASAIGAEIMIITCLEEKPILGFFKTKTNNQEFEKQKTHVEKWHVELKGFSKRHNVLADSKIVRNGMASVRILEFAKQHNADLIIMAKTKITNRYEKQHYQSTIENVLRNAHCPVLIL